MGADSVVESSVVASAAGAAAAEEADIAALLSPGI